MRSKLALVFLLALFFLQRNGLAQSDSNQVCRNSTGPVLQRAATIESMTPEQLQALRTTLASSVFTFRVFHNEGFGLSHTVMSSAESSLPININHTDQRTAYLDHHGVLWTSIDAVIPTIMGAFDIHDRTRFDFIPCPNSSSAPLNQRWILELSGGQGLRPSDYQSHLSHVMSRAVIDLSLPQPGQNPAELRILVSSEAGSRPQLPGLDESIFSRIRENMSMTFTDALLRQIETEVMNVQRAHPTPMPTVPAVAVDPPSLHSHSQNQTQDAPTNTHSLSHTFPLSRLENTVPLRERIEAYHQLESQAYEPGVATVRSRANCPAIQGGHVLYNQQNPLNSRLQGARIFHTGSDNEQVFYTPSSSFLDESIGMTLPQAQEAYLRSRNTLLPLIQERFLSDEQAENAGPWTITCGTYMQNCNFDRRQGSLTCHTPWPHGLERCPFPTRWGRPPLQMNTDSPIASIGIRVLPNECHAPQGDHDYFSEMEITQCAVNYSINSTQKCIGRRFQFSYRGSSAYIRGIQGLLATVLDLCLEPSPSTPHRYIVVPRTYVVAQNPSPVTDCFRRYGDLAANDCAHSSHSESCVSERWCTQEQQFPWSASAPADCLNLKFGRYFTNYYSNWRANP